MTNEANDLGILEDLIKGRKAKTTHNSRYSHPKKMAKNAKSSTTYKGSFNRKTIDMLRTASGKKQAILKITSYGKGEKIRNHLRYISRRGELELEDQDGKKITTISEQNALLRYWSLDFDKTKNSRDSLHIVLSTPPGSDRQAAENIAREFLKEEYGKLGHEYLFVAHNDTDHPHIHAVIKMRSLHGKKLDPRKADLRKGRETFAEKCREHGIEVEASSRAERGLSGKSKRSELVQMNRSNRTPRVDKELIEKVRKEREGNIKESYKSKPVTGKVINFFHDYIQELSGFEAGYISEKMVGEMAYDKLNSIWQIELPNRGNASINEKDAKIKDVGGIRVLHDKLYELDGKELNSRDIFALLNDMQERGKVYGKKIDTKKKADLFSQYITELYEWECGTISEEAIGELAHNELNNPAIQDALSSIKTDVLGNERNTQIKDIGGVRVVKEKFNKKALESRDIVAVLNDMLERGNAHFGKLLTKKVEQKNKITPTIKEARENRVGTNTDFKNNLPNGEADIHIKNRDTLPHPSQEKMLRRNQIIRRRYAERARMLKEHAATAINETEKKQHQANAILLDNYAKNLPVETDRGEKIHRQLDQKYGIPAHRRFKPTEEIEIKNQYEAIKKGRADERGIFLSPAEELANAIIQVQGQQKKYEKSQQTQLEEEQDIDFDECS